MLAVGDGPTANLLRKKMPPGKSSGNIRQLQRNTVFSPTLLTCPTGHAMITAVAKENRMFKVSKTHDAMRARATTQCGTSLFMSGMVLLSQAFNSL
jgi:hypothetical protein